MTGELVPITDRRHNGDNFRVEPPGAYDPPGEPTKDAARKFVLEPWSAIGFDGREEWAAKGLLPRRGLAVIYGKPGSLKSFIASHIALCVALGWTVAGRRVAQAPVVYVAAEGAAGLRKRLAGFRGAHPDLPPDVPFALVSTAPNLGADPGDLPALVSAIERAGVSPGLIVLDTLAQTMGAGDENGAGMTAFVANATALAERLKCLVLTVHHSGLADDRRLRGYSSLHGAVDAMLLCERKEGELSATLTLQKLKDDASDLRLEAHLSRVVIAQDEDGDEISTLVVDAIEDAEPATKPEKAKTIPQSQRLLMACVTDAIDDAGEQFCPFGASGARVCAVAERCIRERYFARIAEQAEPGEDKDKLFDRQRKGFKRAVENALKAQSLMAADKKGERFIWLP